MTMCTAPLVAPRSPTRERRTERRLATGKRLAMARAFPGKIRAVTRRSLDPCDNSNDSGLGFDNHVADHHAGITERLTWVGERAEPKRPRLDIKLEDDEVNDNFSFPETARTCKDDTMSIIHTAPSGTTPSLNMHGTQSTTGGRAVPRCTPLSSRAASSQPITLTSQLSNSSRDSDVGLRIINQPEQQHRARYQTEGSRGAVKDRSGNGFPVVQLTGYHKPATLQVFIGTDVGKVSPHMFYQACRVSGKNSTPCVEKKLDGTVVIELQLDPAKDMIGTCDCVGILKERNVDVEHRFPDQIGSRSKKKSTRCRMVFRTTLIHDNGVKETLQVCSQPIVCTQPPGIPEICKKSLTSCPATGGLELFILGKNFLKDTKVFFQQADEQGLRWEQFVIPDKEFLQQTHLVCVIPPYARSDITEPVTVRLLVVSSGKTSEPHQFVYTPTSGAVASVRAESVPPTTFMNKTIWSSMNKHEQGIMPPPGTNHMPISQRRSSINISSDVHSPPLHSLKQEMLDENSQNSIVDPLELHRERYRNISESSLDVQQGDSNLAMINESSMDILRRNSVSLDTFSQGINENSMNSMSENEMEMIVRRNSISQNSMDVPMVNTGLTVNENNNVCLTPSHQKIGREELSVIDLRMKMPAATVADLANTHAPSLATLQSFCVTEHTNMPLPTQSVQSIESYLSTIETKPLGVDGICMNRNSTGTLHHIINSQKISNQMISPQNLLATGNTQSLTHLNAISPHLLPPVPNFSQNLMPVVRTNNDQHMLQNSLMPITNTKHDRDAHSPQDILIGNKSPMLPSTSQDILLNSAPQPMLIIPPSNLEQSDVNSSSATQNISPDIILNSQISPSLMCRNTSAISQEGLLSICQPNVTTESNIIALPNNVQRSPLNSSSPTHSNQITTVITTTEPEKAILFKAAVDLLETQKKLSELETLTTNNSMEQVIINGMLSPSRKAHSPGNNLNSLVDNNKDYCVSASVKDIANQIQSEKKNEDLMIPTSFATMSENDLINIINPSCFDQGKATNPLAKVEFTGQSKCRFLQP